MVPSTRTSSPPANDTSALLNAGASLDIVTVIPIPARAAYNDHAPPALPALGITTRSTPSSIARDKPIQAPRALKVDPGRGESSLIQVATPKRSESRSQKSRGVSFSPNDTGASCNGNNSS